MTITIHNNQFKVEYDYEDLKNSQFDSYERHVIWRYNNLKEEVGLLSRKDEKIIKQLIEKGLRVENVEIKNGTMKALKPFVRENKQKKLDPELAKQINLIKVKYF